MKKLYRLIPVLAVCILSSCSPDVINELPADFVSEVGLHTLYPTTTTTAGVESSVSHTTVTTATKQESNSSNSQTTSSAINVTVPTNQSNTKQATSPSTTSTKQEISSTTKPTATTQKVTTTTTKKPATTTTTKKPTTTTTTKKPTTTTKTSTPKSNSDPWKYPYDLNYIYADCKKEIEKYGVKWDDNLTIDNASWDNPENTVYFTNNPDGIYLRDYVFEYIEYYCNISKSKPRSMRVYFKGPFTDFLGTYYPYDYEIYCLIMY